MFPNPQAALPLPPRPSLEQYKKLAKDLVKVCKAGSPERIRDWASKWVGNLVRLSNLQTTSGLPQRWIDEVSEFAIRKLVSGERGCTLADAQFVIARSHGFTSWSVLAKHIEQQARKSSSVAQFEAAADAIVSGDIQSLKLVLKENPELVTRYQPLRSRHSLQASGRSA